MFTRSKEIIYKGKPIDDEMRTEIKNLLDKDMI